MRVSLSCDLFIGLSGAGTCDIKKIFLYYVDTEMQINYVRITGFTSIARDYVTDKNDDNNNILRTM
jgi:hypothetical protein